MKRSALFFAWLPGLLCAQPALPTPAADLARAVRAADLDQEQCYLVRDLAFSRDEIKIFFNDGYLIFTKAVAGERIAAVFASDGEDPADGELLLLPPTRDERQSLAKFTRTPNLDEHFSTALVTFTDDTGRQLLDQISAGRGRSSKEVCEALAARWSPVITGLNESLEQRIVGDLLSPVRPGGGFLFLALQSERLGNFDVIFDPLGDDQILAGQLSERSGVFSYEVWTSFPSRAVRLNGEKPATIPFTVTSYRISAALDETLRLQAVTKASIQVGPSPGRVLTFGISRAEQVTSARLDGAPVEILFRESTRARALRADENDLFLVVAPNVLDPGSIHELELEHGGEVIVDRGSNVFSVGARSNWYPRIALEFADYDVEFRYPNSLTLVSAGEVLDDRVDGDFRVTRRRTSGPIRVAGFNLGNYARVSKTADGLTVDVYGNRGLDPALAPKPRATIVTQPVRPLYRGAVPAGNQTTTIIQTPAPPDPLGRLEAVAADVSQSLQFYTSLFGPPPLKTLTVAPIPGTTGQGFPGLIYLSTLSYLDEAQRPENTRDLRLKTFFSDLMVAHEVAHQWWGNIVSPAAYQDEWIVEALAQYSALLWLEKKRGPEALQAELGEARIDLLASSADGGTVQSFGPLTWGYRLEAARNPDTWRLITYEKGAWVMHMLRQRMGDARFLAMLSELRKRFEYRAITTAELQRLAAEFAARPATAPSDPPPARPDAIGAFFDSWVRSTGVPSIRLRYNSTGRAPSVRVSGTATYEDSSQRGVFSDFTTEVPVQIEFAGGAKRVEWIRTSDGTEPFSFTLPQAPTRITLLSLATLATAR